MKNENGYGELVAYIFKFLTGSDFYDRKLVGYTANENEFAHYKLVIVPSDFFETANSERANSVPKLPLQEIEGIPLLFGKSLVERKKDTLVVYADLIASAFFLLSRFEETTNFQNRDEHGRFRGIHSLPYRAGFLHRPVVDEYGVLLRKYLRECGLPLSDEKTGFSRIFLTHDVDTPFYCRTVRSLVRLSLAGENIFKLLKYKFGKVIYDPYFTFPEMLKTDALFREKLQRTA